MSCGFGATGGGPRETCAQKIAPSALCEKNCGPAAGVAVGMGTAGAVIGIVLPAALMNAKFAMLPATICAMISRFPLTPTGPAPAVNVKPCAGKTTGSTIGGSTGVEAYALATLRSTSSAVSLPRG